MEAVRIRSIRPEFWSSEDIAVLDWHERLVYIGLWSYVDDNGVGRDLERLIVTDLFPLDEDLRESSLRVHGALKTLESGGQITRYRVGGKPYLHITAWGRHQKINRPTAGRYPLPTCDDAQPHVALTEPSVSPHENPPLGEGEKGRRGEVEEAPKRASAPTADRGSRLPEDWMPDEKLMQWASEQRPDLNLPDVIDSFRNHWISMTGASARKRRWDLTFQNWVKREKRGPRNSRPAVNAAGYELPEAWR